MRSEYSPINAFPAPYLSMAYNYSYVNDIADHEQHEEGDDVRGAGHCPVCLSQHPEVHGGDPHTEQRDQRGGPQQNTQGPNLHLLVHLVPHLAPHPHHWGPPLHWPGLHEHQDIYWNQAK